MRTPDSPAVAARALSRRSARHREGTVLSFTTVRHPPRGFPDRPRRIGLIELTGGERVLGELAGSGEPCIGRIVVPRMRLSRINEQGLRLYDTVYELTARVREERAPDHAATGYILALTGPSGVGKSTISKLLTKMLADFTARVPIVTTREPKDGDEQEYEFVPPKEFERLKRTGALVAATRIPSQSEERSYGYRGSAVAAIWKTGKIPVVVTEMQLLKDLATHYGRGAILSFGLLPPGTGKRAMLSSLLHRLRQRGRETEKEIEERLLNARADLDFFHRAADLFDHLVVNEDLDTVLQTLKGHVLEAVKA